MHTSKSDVDVLLAVHSLCDWASVEVGEVVDNSDGKCHD